MTRYSYELTLGVGLVVVDLKRECATDDHRSEHERVEEQTLLVDGVGVALNAILGNTLFGVAKSVEETTCRIIRLAFSMRLHVFNDLSDVVE